MNGLNTIFAVIPAAPAAPTAVAAFQALPTGAHARMVGVHVSPIAISIGLVTDIAISSYIEAQIEAAAKEREATEEAFARACGQAGIAFEWRSTQSVDAVVSAHAGATARAADLVLCPTLAQQASLGRHRLEEVVFASGRPVIALPPNWSGARLGKRTLIAWDGGREATRAAFDAMPLLRGADEVRLVSVNGFQGEPVRQFTPGDEIAATLSRHGVPVESLNVESTRRSAAEELQSQAVDFGADLLVMGCYGHSRFRERILGGVSRDMLSDVPFPLLLSN